MTDQHARTLFGAIEVGGTKVLCGVGNAAKGSLETIRIDTGDVVATTRQIEAFFLEAIQQHGPIAAVGIGSFGPLDLDPASATFGQVTTTPKLGWQGADLPAVLHRALGIPVTIDTDVNVAALAEARVGAARGRKSVAYITVGTGIGVGLVIDDAMVSGLGHPEAGHLLPRRHPAHNGFIGTCPFHQDCLEGLASGPAIIAAWGGSLADLPGDHPAWDAQADYLGQLCATLILTIAPEHIVLGGGVMAQERLFPNIRRETLRRLAGYSVQWDSMDVANARITPPGCAEPPGLTGAYLIAKNMVDKASRRSTRCRNESAQGPV
jgi:fructokinase